MGGPKLQLTSPHLGVSPLHVHLGRDPLEPTTLPEKATSISDMMEGKGTDGLSSRGKGTS